MLEDTGLSFEEFCEQGIITGEMRYEKYKTQGFPTPSGKFELFSQVLKDISVSPLPIYREPDMTPLSKPDLFKDYPLILTTGSKVIENFNFFM